MEAEKHFSMQTSKPSLVRKTRLRQQAQTDSVLQQQQVPEGNKVGAEGHYYIVLI